MTVQSEVNPVGLSWKSNFRNMFSLLPKVGLVKKSNRPHGISFVVPLKDDEPWIRATLLSILPYADEIIVVDSSTEDNSPEIVANLADQYPEQIRHIRFLYDGFNAIVVALHIGLSVSRFKYFWKWDADLIAADGFAEWRKRLDNLDPSLYYVVQVGRVNLKGDLYHQPKSEPFYGNEGKLFTISPELRWIQPPKGQETCVGDSVWGMRLPPWYKLLRWREPYVFHCNIRTPVQRVLQYWRSSYEENPENYLTLWKYTEFKVKSEWGMTMQQAADKLTVEMMDSLIPYDQQKYGRLPDLLRKIAERDG